MQNKPKKLRRATNDVAERGGGGRLDPFPPKSDMAAIARGLLAPLKNGQNKN